MNVTLESPSVTEMDAWAMKWLASRGYKVSTPGDWMPLGKFLESVDLTATGFHRIRNREGCPQVEVREGPTGRWIALKATDDLRKFCRVHKGDA